MTEGQRKIFEFGVWCVHVCRDNPGDNIDGGDAEDKMLELGILHKVLVTESCGEGCWCADWDDFPQECLRLAL
jgi:hypothetical protein